MKSNSQHLWLLFTFLIGFGLLTWQLDDKSFWCDELFTVRMADSSPGQILTAVAADLHPPLYFLVMKGWATFAGTGECALRLPSVIFALLSVWFTWLLGMKTVGREATYAGVIALACSPLFIEFSRMARYYSMTLALGVLATFFFVSAGERNRWRDWAGYGISCTLLLYTFYLGGTLILAHALFLALKRGVTRALRIRWLVCICIVGITFAGWSSVVGRGQIGRAGWHRADLAGSVKGMVLSLIYPWYTFSVGETVFPWFPTALPATCAVLVLIIVGAWSAVGQWRVLLLSLTLLPVLVSSFLVVFVSTATPFLNVPVRCLFVLPYFSLALGAGWTALPRTSWRAVLTLLMVFTWSLSLFNYYTNRSLVNPIYSTPVREVAQEIAGRTGTNDMVISEEASGFSYYFTKAGKATPYFEARDTAAIIDYATAHPVEIVWLITIGRDGTRHLTPVNTVEWLKKNFTLVLEKGYTEQDPVYRKVKEFILRHPTYRYRLLVQRYERRP